ncbi:MAG: carboxylate-amine ligase, YbdK family [halophilic archaeon J07HX5]|jgi:uncharacterized enzyme|nr:MAG: carboxylate-amine ligase, YbdK family [halophilic archaeon J07HX5]
MDRDGHAGGGAATFRRLGTIGVEEEYFIVDETGRPVAGTDTLVYGPDPPAVLADRLDHELFKCVIETQTPVIERPEAIEPTVKSIRTGLLEHARAQEYDIAAAGLHPAAQWRALDHARKDRYQAQLDRIQYPQHRNTTAGLHIHIGVDDPDKAVWVANEVRWHAALVLALAANSPYWNGFDTGLASARALIFEGLPNTGLPTAFDSYAEFAAFEQRLLESGAIADRGELWYDVRPHTGLGTVELRVPDAQHDPAWVTGLVKYVHALVLDLCARYEDGEPASGRRREILDHNKWRALRHGHDAKLFDRELSTLVDLGELVEREVDRLGVTALRKLYARESGVARQRRVRREGGPDQLCDALRLDR